MQAPHTVLGIVGSYRRDGHIAALVDAILSAAAARGAATRTLHLSDFDIGFCTNCRGCTQAPGTARVPCLVHRDDMEQLLDQVHSAQALVIGAPVNVGAVNALTQRFVERCIGYYYWPWGTRRGPVLRDPARPRTAVLVSTSAAPAWMNNRLFGFGALHALEKLAEAAGARVIERVRVGMLTEQEVRLSQRTRRKAAVIGERLAA